MCKRSYCISVDRLLRCSILLQPPHQHAPERAIWGVSLADIESHPIRLSPLMPPWMHPMNIKNAGHHVEIVLLKSLVLHLQPSLGTHPRCRLAPSTRSNNSKNQKQRHNRQKQKTRPIEHKWLAPNGLFKLLVRANLFFFPNLFIRYISSYLSIVTIHAS